MNIIPEFKRIQRPYMTMDGLLKATVYADTGTAIYNTPDGNQNATVCSQTAFTNLLENTMLSSKGELIEEVKGHLPHASINKKSFDYPDEAVTSLEIAHRLVSGWFLESSRLVSEGVASKKTGEWKSVLANEISQKGVVPAIAYHCPNSVLHGFMLTLLDKVNPNNSKQQGLMEGSIVAKNINRVQNAGVAFDVVAPTGAGITINGQDGNKKLSSSALGHIPISTSHYLTAEEVLLTARINYRGIQRLPVANELKELICDLANLQMALLLDEEVEVRRDTTLFPMNEVEPSYDISNLVERFQSSCVICKELGLISSENLEFEVEIKEKKVKATAAA